MSQSSIIAAYLLVGFVVFVTMRGELPKYAAVLGFDTVASSVYGMAQNLPTFGGK